MIKTNQAILNSLQKARLKLSHEAKEMLSAFIQSQMHPEGGFTDRSGNSDPYYSVFGYTLSFIFDIQLDIKENSDYLNKLEMNNEPDFIHTVSLLRCYYLIDALRLKQQFGRISKIAVDNSGVQDFFKKKIARELKKRKKKLLEVFYQYQSDDGGFNHLEKKARQATSYANFFAAGLFEDIYPKESKYKELLNSTLSLQQQDGSFVNSVNSESGMSTTTAAGIIVLLQNGYSVEEPVRWLMKQFASMGGFVAGNDLPIPDLLSTATSLMALSLAGEDMDNFFIKISEFVNMHWADNGGFFGSIVDQIPDIEYTFYGLLAIGLLDI